ncbi:MAG: type II toxin-antitoxin system Phd/YefM family antitoxin [Planctomycetota bacterium]|nr:type II toxin-antitoxin system Phd/YefM family antitoxin [Planctomycetota bacterium]
MASISADKAQTQFPELLKRAARDKERIVLTSRGRKVAAVVPIEDLKALEELEDRQDVEDAKKALAEPGKSITLAELKRELGI